MKTILLVEDDRIMNKMISDMLSNSNYILYSAFSIDEAKQILSRDKVDMIILDLNLPDGSGYEILHNDVSSIEGIPVLILTANDLERDVLKGYELGAVEYITKPFSNTILCYKIDAIFNLMEFGNKRNDIYDDGYLIIDFDSLKAHVNGEQVEISPFEYQILKIFIENKNILLTRNRLFELLWDIDENYVEEHTLTAAISRLRKKIDTKDRKYIQTVYGMGYMFIGVDHEG